MVNQATKLKGWWMATMAVVVFVWWVPVASSAEKGIVAEGTPENESLRSYYTKSWAVVIGIDDYDRWPNLKYAVNDARAVAEKLPGLGFDEVVSLYDKQATREKITTLLGTDLPPRVGENDRLLIFYSGHGQSKQLPRTRERKGYVIPVDGDTRNYAATAISMEQLRGFAQGFKAKHIIFIVDACYSGTLISSTKGSIPPQSLDFVRKITTSPAVQVLTAGQEGEEVYEKNGFGIFTHRLLEGLEGAADNNPNDGIITALELGAYLKQRVSNDSNNKQTPQFGNIEGEGDFVFVSQNRPPLPEFGSIRVSTSVPAQLFLEGKLVEHRTTRGWWHMLQNQAPGRKRLEARPLAPGYRGKFLDVDVRRGTTADAIFKWTETFGSLTVGGLPEGTQVIITHTDGTVNRLQTKGNTLTFAEVKSGEVEIVAERTGYQPAESLATIGTGQSVSITMSLIRTTPFAWGAFFRSAGLFVGGLASLNYANEQYNQAVSFHKEAEAALLSDPASAEKKQDDRDASVRNAMVAGAIGLGLVAYAFTPIDDSGRQSTNTGDGLRIEPLPWAPDHMPGATLLVRMNW